MPSRMEEVVAGLEGPSAKIRALNKAGYSRTEIRDFLKVRYQHVRNVLVQDEIRRSKQPAEAASEQGQIDKPRPTKVKVGPDGRVVIPAAFRDVLGVKEGDVLFASIEDGEVRLRTLAATIQRVQAMVRRFVPDGVSLVDELLADRRRDAEKEMSGG